MKFLDYCPIAWQALGFKKYDKDSMIPRPKLGWPIRKVTFGKWKIFISVWTIILYVLNKQGFRVLSLRKNILA